MNECGRCGVVDRDVRLSLTNRHRELRQDSLPIEGPEYEHGWRCRDRDACRERAAVRLHPDGAA